MNARSFLALCLAAGVPFAAQAGRDKTSTPGLAGNAVVTVTATAYTDRASIQRLLGSDLGGDFTLLQVTLTPKSGKLTVHRDDFLLRTDRNGERTRPLAPNQIAGSADMVVHEVQTGTVGTQPTGGPIWGGYPGGGRPTEMPGNGQMGGNGPGGTAVATKMAGPTVGKKEESPLLKMLKEKTLAEKETDQPVSGVLVFNLEKQKLKDLELVYTTPQGPLSVRFR